MPTRPCLPSTPTLTPRGARTDGAQTRQHILAVAAQLCAEQGFQRTTSREICEAAGSNLAAVNYHFGGKEGLFDAVLVEAHAQLMQMDDLVALQQAGPAPAQRLRALITLLVRQPPGGRPAWAMRVLAHEMMVAPSPRLASLLRQTILPKVSLIARIVAEVMDLPPAHPAAQRGLALVVMPCLMLNIAPPQALAQALPALFDDPHGLVEDMLAHALAGLAALGARHRVSDPG